MKSIVFSLLSTLFLAASATPATDLIKRTVPVNIEPTALSIYFVASGAIQFNTGIGLIFKLPSAPTDISTLATFDIPSQYAGMQCAIAFDLSGSTDFTSGSSQFDIFTSLMAPTASTTTWPPGNQRNNQIGRMSVDPITLMGSYVSGFPNFGANFPCPANEMSIELVGVNDSDEIYWSPLSMGIYVTVM